jgi:hypothetical protein
MSNFAKLFTIACALLAARAVFAASTDLARQQIIDETMHPYAGPTTRGADAVDPSTLDGKVLCGYQGWHAAQGDGLGRGWYHWSMNPHDFRPGNCKIDLWPDVSELDPDERYKTAFKLSDGRPAEVYSAFNRKTVLRHFAWMQQYGIDGVFVQRFVTETVPPLGLRQFTTVLGSCREGANRYGRTYAVMYDCSGMGGGEMNKLTDDWKLLIDRMHITSDPAYLHHHGKPVISIWGFGFNDGRQYTLDEGIALVRFLHDDPKYGGMCVMLGVPTYWRTTNRDAVKDPKLLTLIGMADIVSPWAVGRYGTPQQAEHYARQTLTKDIAWCTGHHQDLLPVVYPGFSWHNMNPASPLDQIPRLGGRFLWKQYLEAKRAGATMVYQAMFDEVDEGTAIYKCTNDVPVGESKFVTYEGLPSDHYLKLVGQATRLIRGQIELPKSDELPGLGAED